MITDKLNNWHYIAIKNMKRLIRGVISSYHGEFFFVETACIYIVQRMLLRNMNDCALIMITVKQ